PRLRRRHPVRRNADQLPPPIPQPPGHRDHHLPDGGHQPGPLASSEPHPDLPHTDRPRRRPRQDRLLNRLGGAGLKSDRSASRAFPGGSRCPRKVLPPADSWFTSKRPMTTCGSSSTPSPPAATATPSPTSPTCAPTPTCRWPPETDGSSPEGSACSFPST